MAAKRHDKGAKSKRKSATENQGGAAVGVVVAPMSKKKKQSPAPMPAPVSQPSNPQASSSEKKKKPLKVDKGKLQPKKKEFKKSGKQSQHEKKSPLSSRDRRQHAKELADARKKKRKRHFTLEQELALLWEKMRRRDISREKRSELITEALRKMKGVIPDIAGSHVSSRVLQTCVKHCSVAEKTLVFEELRPHFLSLSTNTYGVHLVKKMLDNASKTQLAGFVASLRGHVAGLLRHMVGSVVVEHAYQLGNVTQKREILMELYSTELQLFKDLAVMSENRLVDIISKLGLHKSSVLRHMTLVIQPILEKGIVDHSIIHKVLIEYLTIADQSSAADVIQQLSGPLLVRMVHTRDGSKIGMLCIKHGSAKERKKIVKGMKGLVGKIAHDHCGSMVLICILSTVDDTKLLTKVVIDEMKSILKELVLDKNGRLLLLHLLHPFSHRYLAPDDLASMNAFIPSFRSETGAELHLTEGDQAKTAADHDGSEHDVQMPLGESEGNGRLAESIVSVEGGKKDPFLRRQELLLNSGLAEALIDICVENAEELLKSNFGKEVIYEVATGGADGILRPKLNDKLTTLHQSIASLAAQPRAPDDEKKESHILENFHSSRTIRKLVLVCPSFASILWKTALQGKCEMSMNDYSLKVVSAFIESPDPQIRELVKGELQPLMKDGKLVVPSSKPAAAET